jgi:hypothetical protein
MCPAIYPGGTRNTALKIGAALLKLGRLGSLVCNRIKNKKITITCQNEDFWVPAEWYFFATSHGNSACDGFGDTLRTLAAKASLQQPYNDQIMTPHQLYEWDQSSTHNLNFDFATEDEYKEEGGLLWSWLATAETQQLHEFMLVKKGLRNTKIYSALLTIKRTVWLVC